ncbi:MAG: formate dehydrogenase subunit gamma [Pseudomonadota bacterium]
MTQEAEIREIASRHAGMDGALLPILHAVQERFGYLPPPTTAAVADVLNLSKADVHGVITFYDDFRTEPAGNRKIRVCRSEACQAVGGEQLASHILQRLGIGFHETTADGRYSLDPVFCLGNCACSPAVMIDDDVHGRVTPERFDALLD